MTGKTTTVTTAAGLIKAAKAARGGDTILLASGNYGDVSLNSLRPAGAGVVTIKSANPDADAVFENLRLTRVNNIVFDDIDISHVLKAGEAEWSAAAAINLSTNVSFVGVDFAGSLNGNRNDDGNGLSITGSSRISILDSTFCQFNNAAVIGRTDDIVFAGNTIREVREGVNISQVNGALFERNFVTDVRGNAAKGDHADAFQVHAGGSAGISTDIAFRSNVIITGPGGAQGIFIKSEKGASEGLVHQNISIENNYVEGNLRNGIAVTWADGVVIAGNTVRDGGHSSTAPGIIVGDIANAVIERNIAPLLQTRSDSVVNTNVTFADNVDVWDASTRRGVSVESVFAAPVGSGSIDFGTLGARVAGAAIDAGFNGVAGIGNLSGNTSAMLAAYMPQFDNGFATSIFV